MHLRKKMQGFFTLTRKASGGFTLVELIVVIAILAILAGVGIPVYSGYITKTNITADETLVGEIKRAVTIALYEKYGHSFTDSIVVKLSATEPADVVSASGNDTNENVAEDIALVEAALVAAFGENWAEVCKLKHSGWTSNAADIVATYDASSFTGNEPSLLNKVGELTGAMADFFASGKSVPDDIAKILEAQGIDRNNPTAVANGAVLALSNSISSADPAVQQEITAALNKMANESINLSTGEADISTTTTKLQKAYTKIYGTVETDSNGDPVLDENGEPVYTVTNDQVKMVTLATTATLYAYAEAYGQYASDAGYTEPATILSSIDFKKDDGTYKNSLEILASVQGAFEQIVQNSISDSTVGKPTAQKYFFVDKQAENDSDAIISIMGVLADSSDVLTDNLTSVDFYSNGDAASILNTYLAVGRVSLGAGEAAVVVNQDKSVCSFLGNNIQ